MGNPYSATAMTVHLWLIFTVPEMRQVFGIVIRDGVEIKY